LGRKVILECSLKGADDPITLLNPRGSKRHLIMSGKYVQRKLYSSGNAFIAKSSYVASLFENTAVASKLIFEVPYAVDTTKYYPPTTEEKIALRRALALPLDKKIICFAGGINARKGVDILVRSFMEVLKHRNDIFLVLIGPTVKYDQLFVTGIKDKMKQVGSNHGLMPGQVSDTYNWMKASDVYVLPSYREGFPISVIESLCCGLIAIGSDIPEIQNAQLVDGENGLIFKQGDVRDLSDKIGMAIEMIDTGNSWTQKSSAEAIEKYRIESVAHQYEKIYDTLLLRNRNA
jgi:glycosyltransferase involved in cell wall biosynthesis